MPEKIFTNNGIPMEYEFGGQGYISIVAAAGKNMILASGTMLSGQEAISPHLNDPTKINLFMRGENSTLNNINIYVSPTSETWYLSEKVSLSTPQFSMVKNIPFANFIKIIPDSDVDIIAEIQICY